LLADRAQKKPVTLNYNVPRDGNFFVGDC